MSAVSLFENTIPDFQPRYAVMREAATLAVIFGTSPNAGMAKIASMSQGLQAQPVVLPPNIEPISAGRVIYQSLRASGVQPASLWVHSDLDARQSPHDALSFAFDMIAPVHEHWGISHIYTSGAPGIEISCAQAAYAHDIDVSLYMPPDRRFDVGGHTVEWDITNLRSTFLEARDRFTAASAEPSVA